MKRMLGAMLTALLVLSAPAWAWATNGMNMIGTGAVSSGMGGADVAVPAGCTAIAGNPAQLATTCNRVVSVGGAFLNPQMEVTLPGQEGVDNEFQLFPLPFAGYAQRIGTSRWSVGVGVFAQGGMGVDFNNVKNFNGADDSLYSQVAFMRLAPTVAYNVTDKLTMGLTAFAGYATIDYDFFPRGTQGQHVTGLSSFTIAGRLGASYQINDQWAVGATYTSESSMDLDGGEMRFNFGPGLGQVNYRDAKMDNFTWPRQAKVGVSFKPASKWLLAFDISWVNWSSAIQTVTVTASNPSTPVPSGYDTLTVPFIMDWKDQWIFALGAQYEINDTWTVRAGYNYGQNPVPDDTLNPLFPAIVQHHITAGFTYTYQEWDFDVALEHGFNTDQTNTGAPSPTNPFSGTEVSHYQDTVHVMVSYRF
ncbi:MAG: outer membrane protein transport protein [Desulfarculaceae bacterium]|nr:outer membrane protein transport protein [Desulfarculaceae bacterium]MCF8047744.1 outer membrane protein transport protein [Desulfarculaceae bacterium]MCF8064638.1 outer membrane protein transport protein [Desulfarculaceae bacterium]MCF8096325.1 outer membrane protein transport protein [Desulfarculaceae bacterium]MCF8123514.1 outer membrane protein transport protein [Desulfarculaceae bacterium]